MPTATTTHGPLGSNLPTSAKLSVVANQTDYFIDATPAMPNISVTAALVPAPDDADHVSYQWTATLAFTGAETNYGKSGKTLTLQSTTRDNVLNLAGRAWKAIRGGTLTISVKVLFQGHVIAGRRSDLRIQGTNPGVNLINAAVTDANVRLILKQESKNRQFGDDRWPLFSSDDLGGAGLGQITPSSEDQRWSWRVNAASAVKKYNSCFTLTNTYVESMRSSEKVAAKVDAINKKRAAAGQPALTVTIPDFSGDQRVRDAVRGYNGWAGRDPIDAALHLHEYRLALDAKKDLKLDIAADGVTATAVWEEVPAKDRPASVGDPDYVNHVLGPSP
jgi:hypothetical protein